MFRVSKILFPLSLSAVMLLPACSDTTVGSFTVDESLPEVRIPSIGIVIPVPSLSLTFPSDLTSQEEFSSSNYDYLTSITPRSMTLKITSNSEDAGKDPIEDGSMDDFDFLSSLELYIGANINGEQKQILVASLPEGDPQYASGTRALNLTVERADVLDYIEAAGGYELTVKVGGLSPPDNIFISGDISFRVGVGFR